MMTVLLATRNGAQWLGDCLDSFCRIERPDGGYKLVVIDNGSTDGTRELAGRYLDRLPLRLISHNTPGKNRALNAGLEYLEGDLAAFTDDDVIVRPDWLCALRDAATRYPDCDVFGGAIVAHWRRTLPEWVLANVSCEMVYGLTDPSRRDGPIEADRIFGGNMMVRSARFSGGMRFDECIGPDGSDTYAMGSETSLNTALAALGARACFVKSAEVAHIIRVEQTNTRWIVQRYFRKGRSAARLGPAARYSGPTLLRRPRYLFLRLLEQTLAWAWAWVRGDQECAFKMSLRIASTRGMIHEYGAHRDPE